MKTGKALLAVVAALFSGAVLGLILSPGKSEDARRKNSKKMAALIAELDRKIDRRFDELKTRTASQGVKNMNDSPWSRKTESARPS